MAEHTLSGTAELAGTAPRGCAQAGHPWGRIAAWAAMGLLLFVSLFPFFWMLRTALSTNADLVTGSQSLRAGQPDAAEPQAGARAGLDRGARRRRHADVGRRELLHRAAQLDDRLHADHASAR